MKRNKIIRLSVLLLALVSLVVYYKPKLDSANKKIRATSLIQADFFHINKIVTSSIATSEDYIYYINNLDKHSLYKVSKDGASNIKLYDKVASIVDIKKDWIYFTDKSGSLLRIKTDGSDAKKITGDYPTSITVLENSIYYIKSSKQGVSKEEMYKKYSQDINRIWKVNLDGSNETRVSNNEVLKFNIADDHIYYINPVNSMYNIYKMKLDGSQNIKLTEEYTLSVKIIDNCIYYLGRRNVLEVPNKLYRINLDGTEKKVILEPIASDNIRSFDINGEYVYFENSNIYKYNTNTAEKVTLLDSENMCKGIVGLFDDWLYFYSTDSSLYKIRTDKTNKYAVKVVEW